MNSHCKSIHSTESFDIVDQSEVENRLQYIQSYSLKNYQGQNEAGQCEFKPRALGTIIAYQALLYYHPCLVAGWQAEDTSLALLIVSLSLLHMTMH